MLCYAHQGGPNLMQTIVYVFCGSQNNTFLMHEGKSPFISTVNKLKFANT